MKVIVAVFVLYKTQNPQNHPGLGTKQLVTLVSYVIKTNFLTDKNVTQTRVI